MLLRRASAVRCPMLTIHFPFGPSLLFLFLLRIHSVRCWTRAKTPGVEAECPLRDGGSSLLPPGTPILCCIDEVCFCSREDTMVLSVDCVISVELSMLRQSVRPLFDLSPN